MVKAVEATESRPNEGVIDFSELGYSTTKHSRWTKGGQKEKKNGNSRERNGWAADYSNTRRGDLIPFVRRILRTLGGRREGVDEANEDPGRRSRGRGGQE
jgi:hypothetical protein